MDGLLFSRAESLFYFRKPELGSAIHGFNPSGGFPSKTVQFGFSLPNGGYDPDALWI
tara:strand:+ start:347 stop:517 length:171 start_codon:yes stop_codon:yes gene_type:complete